MYHISIILGKQIVVMTCRYYEKKYVVLTIKYFVLKRKDVIKMRKDVNYITSRYYDIIE